MGPPAANTFGVGLRDRISSSRSAVTPGIDSEHILRSHMEVRIRKAGTISQGTWNGARWVYRVAEIREIQRRVEAGELEL